MFSVIMKIDCKKVSPHISLLKRLLARCAMTAFEWYTILKLQDCWPWCKNIFATFCSHCCPSWMHKLNICNRTCVSWQLKVLVCVKVLWTQLVNGTNHAAICFKGRFTPRTLCSKLHSTSQPSKDNFGEAQHQSTTSSSLLKFTSGFAGRKAGFLFFGTYWETSWKRDMYSFLWVMVIQRICSKTNC